MTLSVTGLGKRYNREWIFRNLTQDFLTGKCYAITGPNGSGKSTLMQVLWGQLPSSEGTLSYQENNTAIPIDEVYQQITIAAPYQEVVEELTLEELVKFHFRFKKTVHGLAWNDVIEKMELTPSRNKTLNLFSSGMKQRVKLGLALFSKASLIFLDEPTTNLDEQSINWLGAVLLGISPETTLFIASNQPSDYPPDAINLDLLGLKKVT